MSFKTDSLKVALDQLQALRQTLDRLTAYGGDGALHRTVNETRGAFASLKEVLQEEADVVNGMLLMWAIAQFEDEKGLVPDHEFGARSLNDLSNSIDEECGFMLKREQRLLWQAWGNSASPEQLAAQLTDSLVSDAGERAADLLKQHFGELRLFVDEYNQRRVANAAKLNTAN